MINVNPNGQDSPDVYGFYGTVGSVAVQILGTSIPTALTPALLRQLLEIHNPGNSTQLAFTLDGTTPVINGNGFQVYQGSEYKYEIKVPPGPLTLIGNGASCPYSIMSM